MLKQIEELKVRVGQLEKLNNLLEKTIYQQEKQNEREWFSILKNSRTELNEIKSVIETLPSEFKELTEKENQIHRKGSLKKLQKLEKKKERFIDSIEGLIKLCDIFEDNLRKTISQI